ncbi:MAG: Ig-like domain-containing protein, partial [Chloroflexota bacterium]|nr:Ig-like domain-containing protein [Chloroflexota bacterium]
QVCDLGSPVLCVATGAMVTTTVVPIDDRPVALDDSVTTDEDTPVVIPVAANDTDADGNLDTSSVTVFGGPAHGSVTVDPATGDVTYTPDPNYNGLDTFSYEICDSVALCDTADVTVGVTASEDPPVAVNDTAMTSKGTGVTVNVLANDSDPDGNLDPTSVSFTTPPSHGSVSIDPTSWVVTYTPDAGYVGDDSFVYQVCDLAVPPGCATATVSMTVSAGNSPPTATNDSVTTDEDTAVAIGVLANDSDPDGNLDPTSVSVTTPPAHGSVSVNPTSGVVTYTPDPNYNGPDSVVYQVCDLVGNCATATVSLTVTAVNDAPVAVGDSAVLTGSGSVRIDVLANDSDPDGSSDLDPGSVTVTSGPLHGTVTVDPVSGAITYTPDPGSTLPDAFAYRICDRSGVCSTGDVEVGIEPGTGSGLPNTALPAPHPPLTSIGGLMALLGTIWLVAAGIGRPRPRRAEVAGRIGDRRTPLGDQRVRGRVQYLRRQRQPPVGPVDLPLPRDRAG